MACCKSVTFSPTSEMAIVTNLTLGPERLDLWYTQDEMNAFKALRSDDAKRIRSRISRRCNPKAGDVLGMEKFLTVQLTREYAHRRKTLAEEVLAEARCIDVDVDQLARTSAACSRWARQRARAAASFLEEDLRLDAAREEFRRRTRSPGSGVYEGQSAALPSYC